MSVFCLISQAKIGIKTDNDGRRFMENIYRPIDDVYKKSPPPTIACKGRIGWKHKMYEMRLTTLSEKDSNLKNPN